MTPTPSEPKPGFKTSEFWLHAVTAAGGLLYMVLAHAPDVRVALSAQALAAFYTLARTWLKTHHLNVADMQPAIEAAVKVVNAFEAQSMTGAPAPTAPTPAPTPASQPEAK